MRPHLFNFTRQHARFAHTATAVGAAVGKRNTGAQRGLEQGIAALDEKIHARWQYPYLRRHHAQKIVAYHQRPLGIRCRWRLHALLVQPGFKRRGETGAIATLHYPLA